MRPMEADDRAIVVGVSRYPILGDLAGPENDANEFADWLRSPDGGAVPAENVELILSPEPPPGSSPLKAEPTTSALEGAFDEGMRFDGSAIDAPPPGRRAVLARPCGPPRRPGHDLRRVKS